MKTFKLPKKHSHCSCGCNDIKHNRVESTSCDCGCNCNTEVCTCGCAEGKDCTCGCAEGKDCDCDSPEHRRKSKIKIKSPTNYINSSIPSEKNLMQNIAIDKQLSYNHDHKHNRDASCHCDDNNQSDNVNSNKMSCSCGHSHGTNDNHKHSESCCTSQDCLLQNKNKEDGCGCQKCADLKTPSPPISKTRLIRAALQIAISVTLLLFGVLLDLDKYYNLFFIVPSLLVIGGEYIYKAIRNLFKGKILDENLLMSIAAIGAIIIGEYIEGIAVMLLYTIGETLQEIAVTKSKRNISELLSLKTQFASRLSGDTLVKIDSNYIVIGDTLVIANGERIPTDGVITYGTGSIDTSMLTGEYKPVTVREGDNVPCGAIVQGSAITIRVTKLFKDTAAARIMELVTNATDKKPKSQQFITKFAKYYTPIVVFIALIIALVPPLAMGFNENISLYLHKALVFLVISCPCALVISVPLGYFAGIGGAARKGILFKGGNYVEALNTIDTIVLDKTGTLTEGVFEVETICPANSTPTSLLTYAAYAESRSNHPIARSILNYFNDIIDQSKITEYSEIDGKGIIATINNQIILCGKAQLLNENGIDTPQVDTSATIIYLASDGKYMGYITINDKIKNGSKQLINNLKKLGKHVVIMSGDRQLSVERVAKELGVDDYHHSLLPQDKAELVEKLIASGKKVAFVGDGLNDAPVLKLASVGICIGGMNNDASIEAADIVIGGNNIENLHNAFLSSKKTRNIVGQNIAISLLTKIVIMIVSIIVEPLMWLALVADVGVSLLAVLNSLRAMKIKANK